jgi:uncharacterized membrane protein YdjX (TVP38/TMEM64 family)
MANLEETAGSKRPSVTLRWTLLALAALALLILPYLAVAPDLERWGRAAFEAGRGHKPLAAALVIGLLAGDVLLPVPSSAVNTLAGLLFGWAAGAILIWLGLTLGCLLGYVLGARGGRPLTRWMVGGASLSKAAGLFGPVAPATLVLTRAVPVLAEAAVLAAGASGMPLGAFLVATSLANAGLAIVYAGVGALALSANAFLLAFLAAMGLPALAYGLWRLKGSRAAAPEPLS